MRPDPELDPTSAYAYATRGMIQALLEKFTSARADIRRCQELDPGCELGIIYQKSVEAWCAARSWESPEEIFGEEIFPSDNEDDPYHRLADEDDDTEPDASLRDWLLRHAELSNDEPIPF